MIPHRLACLFLGALVAACGGGGGGDGGGGSVPNACGSGAEKNFVLDVTREWYLFPETLPPQVSTGDFGTAQELLDFMTATARAQGRDRYFSYVTTQQADSSFLQEGQFIGFGFRMRIEGSRVFFMEAYESSPASEAGIVRGGELLAIDSGSGYVSVANLLPTDPNLSTALGPAQEGVARGLRFTKPGVAQPVEARLTKRVITIQPIPSDGVAILTLPTNTSVRVGYLNLRSYISTANAPLRNAFDQFRAQGVQYFIVDQRYNGGGLISVAELIGDLFGRNRSSADVYSRLRFRASKSSQDVTHFFQAQAESVAPEAIAFIGTAATASASELTINSMRPWVSAAALIGGNTYGKPVGQSAFDLTGCDTRLRLVTFRSANRDDQSDYYSGLAGTLPTCGAADDLSRSMGDPAEASTAAALYWLATGACPATGGAPAAQKPLPGVEIRYPVPDTPSPAQIHLPGLY
jgi:C-terminal processing protease CtpA/Prc